MSNHTASLPLMLKALRLGTMQNTGNRWLTKRLRINGGRTST